MGVFQNNLMGAAAAAASAGGGDFYSHQIANSCRFNNNYPAVENLSRTQGTPTNVDKCTISLWLKRSKLGAAQYGFTGSGSASAGDYTQINFGGDGSTADEFYYLQNENSPVTVRLESTAVYRDTSAWMHIVIAQDSTQSTAADRNKIYFNGVQYTAWGDYSTYSTLNSNFLMNSSGHTIFVGSAGDSGGASALGFDGYIAEYVFIDGTQSAVTDFGESKNGVWIPKDPSGLTFGNNGCYLKFESSSDLGNDSSGNNNDFTVHSNVVASDQMLDTPTFNSDSNGGNFATYNPLVIKGSAAELMALSEGNLHTQSETNDKYSQIMGNMGVKDGKWYTEFYIKAAGYPSWAIGWIHTDRLGTFNGDTQADNANLAYVGYFTGSNIYPKAFGSTTTSDPQVAVSGWTSAGDAPTTGDVMMCAIDIDAGKVWWGFNGEWGNVGSGTGNPATGANASNTWTVANYPDYKFPFTLAWADPDAEIVMNCGQEGTFGGAISAGGNADDTGYGNFKYDVPAGFLALCSGNLPTADAVDPAQTDDDYPQKLYNSVLYTGNGASDKAVTGVGFQPDWLWGKVRSAINDNWIYDTNRGDFRLTTADTAAQVDYSAEFAQFDSDGWTYGINANSQNANTATFIGRSLRANAGTTSTNSSGSINVTQQVDPSGSFSISTYSGTAGTPTIGHGLSSAPTFVIVKQTNGTHNWAVYAAGAGATKYGFLESTSGFGTDNMWGNTTPSSTLVYLGVYTQTSGSGRNYVAYCFADTEGYIKSGSYEGNGNADGTFVYTGFRPALIMTKSVDSTSNWQMFDDTRIGYNVDNNELQADTTAAETTTDMLDILSNGFKCRIATDPNVAETYIYLAMAHNPFQYATAR